MGKVVRLYQRGILSGLERKWWSFSDWQKRGGMLLGYMPLRYVEEHGIIAAMF